MMTDRTRDPHNYDPRPPLPPPLWQWLCIIGVVIWVIVIWCLWR
jgi:hypothetical protein